MIVGARSSPLSQAQVKEVQEQIPVPFTPLFVDSTGDRDQKTSLRTLDKTNFFTKEIDKQLLEGKCRVAIHSAKDLPDPIPEGLTVVALTKGVNSSDSLVYNGCGKVIATSSQKREEAVLKVLPDATFVDIRGTIHKRLEKMDKGDVDGVVIAEAALIRLGLTHLKRITLPGSTTEFQGQLAILARVGDTEMQTLFSKIDSRNVFHTGLTPPKTIRAIHSPLIQIVPKNFKTPPFFTHVVYTSKVAVRLFPPVKKVFAVGKATALEVERLGGHIEGIAEEETAEGLVALLKTKDLTKAHLFWPHSAKSRDVLPTFFQKSQIAYTDVVAYDTVPNKDAFLPPLERLEEIVFTSPSTVEAFRTFYSELPKKIKLTAIGPITKNTLLLS